MFAQNGEDDFYKDYLDLTKKDGKYIDIGAGKPREISNTELLYNLGWSGLCVEPNPKYLPMWAVERPRDIFVITPIMDKECDMILSGTVMPGSWLYEEYVKTGHTEHKVHCIRLEQLLEKYPNFYEPDLFSLDVELSEDKVLSSVDFNIFKPKLIVIEKCVRDIDSKPLWEHMLLPFYDSVKEFPGNTFYLRKK